MSRIPKYISKSVSFVYLLIILGGSFLLSTVLDSVFEFPRQIDWFFYSAISFAAGASFSSLNEILKFNILKVDSHKSFNYFDLAFEIPNILSEIVEVKEIETFINKNLRQYLQISNIALLIDKQLLNTKKHKIITTWNDKQEITGIYEKYSLDKESLILTNRKYFPELYEMGYQVCVPIKINRIKQGMVLFGGKISEGPFDPIELTTITSVVIQISATIQRIKPYEVIKLAHHTHKEKMNKEYSVAQDIQQNLLPIKAPSLKHATFDTLFISAKEVSGDYYDFFVFSKYKVGIIIVDIVGKGIPAAFTMINLKGIIHRNIDHSLSPQDFMTRINTLLYLDRSIPMFVPTFYGVLDLKKNEFSYVNTIGNAGAVYLAKAKSPYFLDKGGFMLGASEHANYEEEAISFGSGDQFLFFTDGITEQKNLEGQEYNLEGIIKSLEIESNTLTETQKIHAGFKKHKGPTEQKDDITIISLKID